MAFHIEFALLALLLWLGFGSADSDDGECFVFCLA